MGRAFGRSELRDGIVRLLGDSEWMHDEGVCGVGWTCCNWSEAEQAVERSGVRGNRKTAEIE